MFIEEGNHRGSTKVKLEQVPAFLVNAFNFINIHGMEMEGLFRREGNIIRLNQNNYVGSPIPSSDFTVHDVCSMVKRFFRDLKEPLLSHPLLRENLMNLAKKSDTKEITRQEFCTVFEPAFKGTLGYLMRQLHRVGVSIVLIIMSRNLLFAANSQLYCSNSFCLQLTVFSVFRCFSFINRRV
ncbi:unnamed protein product [Angiostrongylus costaricensis]|uniref:Rho-GAP domain-containing protein n=1 Tax=Angiostrongylus costaricensis TaxID=334426 RepID=A0A0R3PK51_ANGCS|nr:unnamed protein product [Angiostrongylus costaricensis]